MSLISLNPELFLLVPVDIELNDIEFLSDELSVVGWLDTLGTPFDPGGLMGVFIIVFLNLFRLFNFLNNLNSNTNAKNKAKRFVSLPKQSRKMITIHIDSLWSTDSETDDSFETYIS